ncbi:MAG TPA: 2Fe-2S iron-sulfur cluster-binding protein [Gemmatimonadales bacterium]|nr:2Fe-2S iron-sulfur cluster-binding protein [Gemmatimonadales bacterium]
MSELVNLTIDGTPVAVPKGTTIIEAAKQAGVLVPHYCYHPSLPSPAVCRMCLVEVEKNPKLQPSCVTTVAEGQVVHVHSDAAKKAREGVLEFLLINHPLDCPICDQAGECELQDYVFQEGRSGTRYSDYAKRYNPVEDFGADVLYVANRCILCTRCVRFMDDVAEEPVLNVSERGDRAFIGIDPAHKLTHEWSGNVVDLCPVGALVSKDFLHKARAWDLDKAPGICTGCSQGCNTTVETRDDTVVRLKPRPNLEVNRHFICDTGRADYRWMNRGDRVEAPLVRQDGKLVATDWLKGLEALAAAVKGASGPVVVLASGRASVESLAAVKHLVRGAKATLAVQVPMSSDPEKPLAGVPGLALRQERAPNAKGAEWLGYSRDWSGAVAAAKGAALVLVVGAELTDAEWAAVKGARTVAALAAVDALGDDCCHVVLPITTAVEELGVYVNRDGRIQRYWPAKAAPGMARPAWWVAGEAASLAQGGEAPQSAEAAYDLAATLAPQFGAVPFAELGFIGRVAQPAGVA